VRPARLRHVDPGVPRGRAFRWYARTVGTSRAGIWFSRTFLWKLDPHLMRVTGGRLSLAFGLPRALLETTGARTGASRRHAVIYFHDGETPTIVASRFGDPQHPAWFHNARANPAVTFAGRPFRAVVVEDPDDLERLWGLADAVFPPFETYREMAARTGRTIPILQLLPRLGS
jgi:deazaflavin-dependent oxidoreductase (nitroreductase family)